MYIIWIISENVVELIVLKLNNIFYEPTFKYWVWKTKRNVGFISWIQLLTRTYVHQLPTGNKIQFSSLQMSYAYKTLTPKRHL